MEQAVGGVGEVALLVGVGAAAGVGGGVRQLQRVRAYVFGDGIGDAVIRVGFLGGHGLPRYEYIAVSVEMVVRHQYPPVVGEAVIGVSVPVGAKGNGEVVGIIRVTISAAESNTTPSASVGLQVAEDRAAVFVTAGLHDHARVVAGARELKG